MATTAVSLSVLAAVLEIWGIVWTVLDIRKARRRLAQYLHRGRHIYASGTLHVEAAMPLTVQSANSTVEQRVEALETQQQNLKEELARRDRQLIERLSTRFGSELKATEKTLDDQLTGLRDYIKGAEEHWWKAYRGPLVLVLGVIAGLFANIFSAAS
ncbi:hypothetical protein ACFWA4_05825 [Streptomyces sp. NPDC060011]|uniref:hypothetical protein n=1 Tax=Streptomyces sp. NPDC060011 TaxID=3347037 RepID=UPI0036BFBC64